MWVGEGRGDRSATNETKANNGKIWKIKFDRVGEGPLQPMKRMTYENYEN